MKTKVLIMLLAFIVIIFSCEDEESENQNDIIPDELVGTWIWEATELYGIGHTREYILMSFSKEDSKNGLFEQNQIADWQAENVFHVLEGTKGTFTVNKDIMYLVATHFGSEIGLDDVTIYDTTMWWNQEDPEFDNFEFTNKYGFEVIGNSLIIKTDGNNDGDFNDEEDDTSILTKVNI